MSPKIKTKSFEQAEPPRCNPSVERRIVFAFESRFDILIIEEDEAEAKGEGEAGEDMEEFPIEDGEWIMIDLDSIHERSMLEKVHGQISSSNIPLQANR
jgi:hypothetical protein